MNKTQTQIELRAAVTPIVMILTPLLLIGILIAALILLDGYISHNNMLERMTEQGLITTATIRSISDDFVFVNYEDAEGNERSGVLDRYYYPPSVWARHEPGETLTIRYLPRRTPGSDRVLLEDRFADVRDYQDYFDSRLLIMLAICWGGLIMEPAVLFLGFMDNSKQVKVHARA